MGVATFFRNTSAGGSTHRALLLLLFLCNALSVPKSSSNPSSNCGLVVVAVVATGLFILTARVRLVAEAQATTIPSMAVSVVAVVAGQVVGGDDRRLSPHPHLVPPAGWPAPRGCSWRAAARSHGTTGSRCPPAWISCP